MPQVYADAPARTAGHTARFLVLCVKTLSFISSPALNFRLFQKLSKKSGGRLLDRSLLDRTLGTRDEAVHRWVLESARVRALNELLDRIRSLRGGRLLGGRLLIHCRLRRSLRHPAWQVRGSLCRGLRSWPAFFKIPFRNRELSKHRQS